jgi:molybdopterin biosynthesis enzyme MoaB
LAIVAAGSLVLCVHGSPAAVIRFAIDGAILAVIGYVAL